MNKNILLHIFIMYISLCMSTSCQEERIYVTDQKQDVTVLFNSEGIGDRNYNDLILKGLQAVKNTDDININIYNSTSDKFAEKIIRAWLIDESLEKPSLLILPSPQYEKIAEKVIHEENIHNKDKTILILGTSNNSKLPIHYLNFSMYGESYIAGIAAAQYSNKAMVLLGNDKDNIVNDAAYGFKKGYEECNKKADIKILSNKNNGYTMSAEAYEKMHEWGKTHDLVYALAGGSNIGIFRYIRQYNDIYAIGSFVDQSFYSQNIIGSTIIRIDEILSGHIIQWIRTKTIPKNSIYGLSSKYVEFIISPLYMDNLRNTVDNIKNKAIEEEIKYYENK